MLCGVGFVAFVLSDDVGYGSRGRGGGFRGRGFRGRGRGRGRGTGGYTGSPTDGIVDEVLFPVCAHQFHQKSTYAHTSLHAYSLLTHKFEKRCNISFPTRTDVSNGITI